MKTTKQYIAKLEELENGDKFSFRTIKTPIWYRFIEIKDGILIYEEIRSGFRHSSTLDGFLRLDTTVLKKSN